MSQNQKLRKGDRVFLRKAHGQVVCGYVTKTGISWPNSKSQDKSKNQSQEGIEIQIGKERLVLTQNDPDLSLGLRGKAPKNPKNSKEASSPNP